MVLIAVIEAFLAALPGKRDYRRVFHNGFSSREAPIASALFSLAFFDEAEFCQKGRLDPEPRLTQSEAMSQGFASWYQCWY